MINAMDKEKAIPNETRIQELLEILDSIEEEDGDEALEIKGEIWRIEQGEAA